MSASGKSDNTSRASQLNKKPKSLPGNSSALKPVRKPVYRTKGNGSWPLRVDDPVVTGILQHSILPQAVE